MEEQEENCETNATSEASLMRDGDRRGFRGHQKQTNHQIKTDSDSIYEWLLHSPSPQRQPVVPSLMLHHCA